MNYRIAILPSAKASKTVGKLATQFSKKFPSYFAVDNKKLLPHITLLVVDMPAKKRNEMFADVKEYLVKQKPISLVIKQYESHRGGWFSLEVNHSFRLAKLRLQLARKLRKYGKISQEVFMPHITLTKYKKEEDAKLSAQSKVKASIKVKAEIVGICLSNKYSQVYKVINKYKLT